MNKPRAILIVLAEIRESARMAFNAILDHKLRSALTLLGVLIGVFSIIIVMTAMRVLQSDIEKNLSQLGANTFMIQKWPGVYFGGPGGFEKFWRRKNVTYSQARRLLDKATLPANIGVETSFWAGQVQTRDGASAPNVRLFGETPGSFAAKNWTLAEGRLLAEGDVENGRDVCVLGAGLATNVFAFGNAVGQRIKLDGINYTVVGVLEKKGTSLAGDQDNFAVIPITTGLDRYGRRDRSVSILVQAPNQETYEATVEQTRSLLRVIRKVPPGEEDDFELFSNDSMIAQFENFTRAVRIGVAVVSSIALLASGIGIMNIMLVSVTERTREIGIRRAIGAKRRSIMSQFIMEAIVLCEIGGVIGVILGILGGNLLAVALKLMPVIPVDWVVIGLGICSAVGILFGTYPAYKAAHLDPIESLRYE